MTAHARSRDSPARQGLFWMHDGGRAVGLGSFGGRFGVGLGLVWGWFFRHLVSPNFHNCRPDTELRILTRGVSFFRATDVRQRVTRPACADTFIAGVNERSAAVFRVDSRARASARLVTRALRKSWRKLEK